MKAAPFLKRLRTSRRTASGPSASPPPDQPCPPVEHTTAPAMTSLGPTTFPPSTAAFNEYAVFRGEPVLRIVVTPDSSARFIASVAYKTRSSSPHSLAP